MAVSPLLHQSHEGESLIARFPNKYSMFSGTPNVSIKKGSE